MANEELVLATSFHNTEFSHGASLEDFLELQFYVSPFFKINREVEQWYYNIFPPSFHYRFQTDVIWNLTYMLKHGNGYALIPKGFIKKGKKNLHKVKCFLDTIEHLIQPETE